MRQGRDRFRVLRFCWNTAFPIALLAASPAFAEEPPTGGAIVTVSPYAWGSALGGSAGIAGVAQDFHLPFNKIVRDLDMAVMGTGEVAFGRIAVFVDGQYVKTSKAPTVLGLAPADIRVRTSRVEGGVYYKMIVEQGTTNTIFGRPESSSFGPIVGARYTDLGVHASALGYSAGKSADWVEPFVGLRGDMDLGRRWKAHAAFDVGGFGAGSKVAVNAEASIGYGVKPLGQPVVLKLGYRYLYQKYSTTDFTGVTDFNWRVEQHGPVAGFSMVF